MGRKPTRQKTVYENLIKDTWYLTNKGKNVCEAEHGKVLAAIALVLERLEQDARINGANCARVFVECYLVDDIKSKRELTSEKLLARAGIEILHTGSGIFYSLSFGCKDNIVKLLKMRHLAYKFDIAADFLMTVTKLRADTNKFMKLFGDFYSRLKLKE